MANLVACVADSLTEADALGVEGAPHLNRRHVSARQGSRWLVGDKRSRPSRNETRPLAPLGCNTLLPAFAAGVTELPYSG
jgi:hypothetical protein